MNWAAQDNKRYRGKVDRIFVSRTEYYEVDYFVDEYLRTRGYTVNDNNRIIIHGWLDAYPGRAPILRTDVEGWMDRQIAARKSAAR